MKTKNRRKPPFLASQLLKLLSGYNDKHSIIEDFEETFYDIQTNKGLFQARHWYWTNLIKSMGEYFKIFLIWRLIMFNNYTKIAIRNILKQKGYSFINLSGLAIGLACCTLMLLWVQHELSFDRFHKNINRIYRVVDGPRLGEQVDITALSQPPVALGLKRDYPQIIKATRFDNGNRRLVKHGETSFNETNYAYADQDFFTIFSFTFIEGDPETALKDPYSVVITREISEKYFGAENPLGKIMNLDSSIDVTVTGVIKSVPDNSSIQFSFISPFAEPFFSKETLTNWKAGFHYAFVLLDNNVSAEELDKKISNYLIEHDGEANRTIDLQWFRVAHLFSDLEFEFDNLGNIKYIYIFTTLAIFILLIACINYMNLATARSANRAKEVGMRKVTGARKKEVIIQFLFESMTMSLLAGIFALVLVQSFLPLFNGISGKHLFFNFSENASIFIGLIFTASVTGILSGIYPAFFLASFRPVRVLKGTLNAGTKNSQFRRILVVFQFSLSILLIIVASVVTLQLSYMRKKALGYDKDHLLVIPMYGEINKGYNTFKSELLKNSEVLKVTRTFSLPTEIRSSPGTPDWEGKDPDVQWIIRVDFVDFDYFETFGMKMALGRSFSKEFSTDESAAFIVNEEAVKKMKMESPVGKKFSFMNLPMGRIIGVVKNFHHRSLHHKIEPLAYTIQPWWRRIIIRIYPDNVSRSINTIKKTWEKHYPDNPFEYSFFDEGFDKLYLAEQRVGQVVRAFTCLAIFIACLGLLGLAAFMAQQRTKEIGIRKVLGASITSVVLLLSREFTKWVALANLIAWPIAWYTVDKWLEGFAYAIDINIGVFLIAGLISLTIAFVTVSFQTIKAAIANPVDSVKVE